ncbi:DUF6252 family protein [Emticicia agri]|uniref:Lipoprotein n=1 Tax=Emticicia agri TaxID=2492393 RepID=A0A4Q5LU77_9BACT|nr:DUF6252 family protein [Emticicia agri]RYU93218.1 hypothetical protein EWM59_23055 [Emticicia agri]
MKTTILIGFLAFTLTGCSFIKSLKPKETFFCKVNGEKFKPDKDTSPVGSIGSDPLSVQFDRTNGWFSIVVRKVPNAISLIIKVIPNEPLELKEYKLSDNTQQSKAYYNLNYAEQYSEALISNSGIFRITKIDGYNLSGTFEFICKSAKTGKEYKITNGEFNDISYY